MIFSLLQKRTVSLLAIIQITGLIFLPQNLSADAQEPFTGEVRDAGTGEPIPGVTLLIQDENRGTTTDADGRFRMDGLEPGEYGVRFRFVGYSTLEIEYTHPGPHLELELEPETFQAEDIIVTASPVGRNIRYQSAQAYGLQELQERASSSIGQMLDGEPGIAMRSFGPAPARPVIRGFDGDRLLVLENGERMGDLSNTAHDHNVLMEPLVPDRIEVVRGPASLLYGSSALGGVVNILTSDIPTEWSPGASGTVAMEGATVNDAVSGFGRYQYGADRWAATGRFSYRGAGDMRTPDGRLPGSFLQSMEGGAGFGHRSGRLSSGVSITARDYNYGLPEGVDESDEKAEIVMNQQSLQGRLNWDLDGFLEKAEFRFNGSRLFQQEIETEFQTDGTIDEDIELEFLQHQANGTLTLQHRPAGRLDTGVVGVNTRIRGLDAGGDEAFSPGVDSRSAALFTFHEIPLNSLMRFQFGVRGELQSVSTRANDAFPEVDESRTNRALSGAVGLNSRPVDGLEIGLQLARAHRFPILEELYANGVHFGAGVFERGNPDLGTEIGHGADLFVRWDRGRFQAEVAGFYYLIGNYVAFEPSGQIFVDDRGREWDRFEYRARNARMAGGEAQVSVQLTYDWSVGAAADFVHGTRLDNGSPLPTMPPFRMRFTSRYDTGRWWLAGNLQVVHRQSRVVEYESETDGYLLAGMNAGIRFNSSGTHRLSLQVENLTDRLYRDHLSRVDRTEFGMPMPGRNISLSYRFLF